MWSQSDCKTDRKAGRQRTEGGKKTGQVESTSILWSGICDCNWSLKKEFQSSGIKKAAVIQASVTYRVKRQAVLFVLVLF